MVRDPAPRRGGDAYGFRDVTDVGALAVGRGARAIANIVQRFTTVYASVDAESDHRDRRLLRDMIRRHWIKGFLEASVTDATLIDVETEVDYTRPQPRPVAALALAGEAAPAAAIPSFATSDALIDLFKSADRSLAIVGPPGSGKTITLLRLARALLDLADSQPGEPIPVV